MEERQATVSFVGQINLATGAGHNAAWTSSSSILAEIGTLQVEFRYLAEVSGNPQMFTKSTQVFASLRFFFPEKAIRRRQYNTMVRFTFNCSWYSRHSCRGSFRCLFYLFKSSIYYRRRRDD